MPRPHHPAAECPEPQESKPIEQNTPGTEGERSDVIQNDYYTDHDGTNRERPVIEVRSIHAQADQDEAHTDEHPRDEYQPDTERLVTHEADSDRRLGQSSTRGTPRKRPRGRR